MKHYKNMYFLFVILLSMISTNIFAYDIKVTNADGVTIYYEWTENKAELSVTSGYPSYSGNVVIPEIVTYNEKTYSVTSIGDYAFMYCSSLTSITIPNSVTSIGHQAFSACSGLTTVTIPNSVTILGNFVFWGCSSLTSINIPNSVTSIGQGAFNPTLPSM